MRPVTSPRTEVAHFHVLGALTVSNVLPTFSVVEIVAMQSRWPGEDPSQGATPTFFEHYAKAWDVVGLVYDYSLVMNAAPLSGVTSYVDLSTHLYSERVGSAGGPVTGPDWTASQPPVAIEQNANNDEFSFPVRVHRKRAFLMASGENNVQQQAQASSLPVRGTERVRLRNSFTDEFGLYWSVGGLAGSAPTPVTFQLHGTLYYRLRHSR